MVAYLFNRGVNFIGEDDDDDRQQFLHTYPIPGII